MSDLIVGGESLATQRVTFAQQATLEELADLTLQHLHGVRGKRRFIIRHRDGEFTIHDRQYAAHRAWS